MIRLNKEQTNKMVKVKHAIEDMFSGNLHKYHITPQGASEILRVYNSIIHTPEQAGSTICSDVEKFFRKKGFFTMEIGIGWSIGISANN